MNTNYDGVISFVGLIRHCLILFFSERILLLHNYIAALNSNCDRSAVAEYFSV